MIRFIWKNWWRRKERLVLLLIGVLIISVGLAYLVGLSETNKGTIVNELEERWSSSYDIVVRPEGTRGETEQDSLLDPNFLSGIDGGITMDQYETIKEITDVDIAAPIAMIGSVSYTSYLESFDLEENGIYRMTKEQVTDNGINEKKDTSNYYFPSGDWKPHVEEKLSEKFKENPEDPESDNYYLKPFEEYVTTNRYFTIAGIDPEQEAKLIDLDDAIMSEEGSRYFDASDSVSNEEVSPDSDEAPAQYTAEFPVIINNQTNADQSLNWQIERLDIPYDMETADEKLDELEGKGGEEYLDTLKGTPIKKFHFDEQEVYTRMVNSIAGHDRFTGEKHDKNYLESEHSTSDHNFSLRPSPLLYQSMNSPFPDKWESAYQLQTFISNELNRSGNLMTMGL